MLIEQQIGMPLSIIMQQQPGMLMQVIMQSQQAMIILQQSASPLVQVMVQPMSVISILHMPMVPMLHMQHIMPLHMQHMEHIALGIIMHRFFIISAAVLSSQVMVHFMPVDIFSIIMVQRGIIIPPMPMEGMFIAPMLPIEDIMGDIIPIIEGMVGMAIMLGIMPPVIPPLIRSEVMLVPLFIVAPGLAVEGNVVDHGRLRPLRG